MIRNILNGVLIAAVAFSNSCGTTGADRSRIDEEMKSGEALYGSNLHVKKSDESNGLSSSIVSQEFLTWKQEFIEKHGHEEWRNFQSKMTLKYGDEVKSNRLLEYR